MKKLSEISLEVTRRIQDKDSYLKNGEVDSCVLQAIRTLSKKKPYSIFESFNGDGSANEWALSSSSWVPGFSSVKTVYYPWDDDVTPTPPAPVTGLTYSVYEKTSGVFWFRLNLATPSASEVVRVYYKTRHSITETTTTLTDEGDEDSIISLAAGLCLSIMAVRAVSVGNPTLNADVTAYQSRQQMYETMAKTFKKESGLQSYLEEEASRGGAIFVSLGRKKRTADIFR